MSRTMVVLLLGALVAGCGTDPASTATTPSVTGTGGSVPPTEPSPDPSTTRPLSNTELPTMSGQPQQPPERPTDSFRPFIARGTIEVDVELGCVELVTDDGGRLTLIGDPVADLATGEEVEVEVMAAPQLETSCQGSPVTVSELRRL